MPGGITVGQSVRPIGSPLAPVGVDLRTAEDFAADPRPIPRAFRHGVTAMDRPGATLAEQRAVPRMHRDAPALIGAATAACDAPCRWVRVAAVEGRDGAAPAGRTA